MAELKQSEGTVVVTVTSVQELAKLFVTLRGLLRRAPRSCTLRLALSAERSVCVRSVAGAAPHTTLDVAGWLQAVDRKLARGRLLRTPPAAPMLPPQPLPPRRLKRRALPADEQA